MTMHGDLAGKRVLVVEDEYFIASDLKRALEKQGAVVIGPVGDLDAGLALVEREQLDGAVLDVNLEGGQTFPIAVQLEERSVPYLFVTGYDAWAMPEAFRQVPRIAKPVPMGTLISALDTLLVTGGPS
jgi:DNA-binding response OmpR family regulator